jgi:hypothetical protein
MHDDTFLRNFLGGKMQLHLRLDKDEKEDGEVFNVRWDPLSEDYLLVVHRKSFLRLVSAQGGMVLANFRHPASCRAHCVAWLPDCPGMFITGGDIFQLNIYKTSYNTAVKQSKIKSKIFKYCKKSSSCFKMSRYDGRILNEVNNCACKTTCFENFWNPSLKFFK